MHVPQQNSQQQYDDNFGLGNSRGPPSQGNESYPDQQAPTDRMLKHWRQLLRSCFLLSTNLIANPPSHPNPPPPTLPPDSFTEYILANAHELSIIGIGVLNQDSIATFLADRISSSLPINTFGDGTVKDSIGAHGWHIRPTLDLTHDRHSIESAAQTDGHQETISSLRTENAAALAALSFLRSVCVFYKIRASTSTILYHLDNKEALRRLNSTDSTSFFDTANPITTDYDVWAALREATSSTPGKHIGIHVKGHHDDDTPLESLSPEAKMNIRMDTLAGECRQLHTRPLETKAHSGNQISLLLLGGHIVTTQIQQQPRSTFTGPLLQTYVQKKVNWDDHIFSMMDWQAHGNYLASLPFPKQVNVIKMLHNWQYTKSRAMLFQDSNSSTCPMGCGNEESVLHHLSCPKIPGSDLRSINRWMSHNNTAPPVQLAIISSLKAWIASDPNPLFLGNDQDPLERITSLAHSEQSILGWNQATKGRLSKKWTATQSKWYDHMRHNHHSKTKFPKNYTGPI